MNIKQKANKFSIYLNIVYPILGVGLFLLLWYIISLIVGIEMLLPSPKLAIEKLFSLFCNNEFWLAVGNTLYRVIISFLIGVLLSGLFAIVSYLIPIVNKILHPIIVILRAVPTMSIILLALIWLKSTTAPILVAFLILFPQLYASFTSSLNGVSEDLIDMSKAFKVPLKTQIFRLYIPQILPSSLDAMRSNISLAVKVIIAGEVLAQTINSMGIYMQMSRIYFDTAELLGWTIMAIILSYILESIFFILKYFATRWKNANK